MKRRDFINTIGLGAAALSLSGCRGTSRQVTGKGESPNILFLFTDDQRFDTLGALNNPEVRTPNMDRLLRGGLAFTRAHVMGSMRGGLCMPSRAMLMTGRGLFHIGDNGVTIPTEYVMMPEALQQAGYRTFGTGKWHNDANAYARCFADGGNIFFRGMSDHLKVPVHDFNPAGQYPLDKQYIADGFSSEIFSDTAIRFLNEYEGDSPFFAYVSYTAPHDPRMAPKEYADMYRSEKVKLPENFMPEHPFDNGVLRIRDERLAPFPRTPEIVREHIAAYYGMITHVDAQIGRVLQALEESGRADNTIIIFTADNGLAVGQHGLFGKQNLYEHSIRVPLIMNGPGLPRGKTCDTLCYLLDIYPTICDLTGIPAPASVEGLSLGPALKDQTVKIRDSIFYAYMQFQRGVRTDRWKLILYNVDGRQTTQLFDLHNDPWELNNLADDPVAAGRIEELTHLLKKWMEKTGDECDLDKPDWGFGMSES